MHGQAAQFVRGPGFVSAAATTAASGIGALLPGAAIDDYVFEPCGYSMNGVDGAAFTTIHVTPEEGFSYASVELCGYAAAALDASAMVAQARPRRVFCQSRSAGFAVFLTGTAFLRQCGAFAGGMVKPAAGGASCWECSSAGFELGLLSAWLLQGA